MRFRPGHLALLVFQAIWLNVILPGHNRGVVTVPGAECTQCPSSSENPGARRSFHQNAPHDRQEKPSSPANRASHCAICAFAARLTLPPVIDLTPPALGFLERLALSPLARPTTIDAIPAYYGRGPPAFA